MKIKNNQGVTIIVLVITIIVLLILSGIIVSGAKNQQTINNINKLNSDIETIEAKVTQYYLKNNDLPIFKSIENEEQIVYALNKNDLIGKFEKQVQESLDNKIKENINKQINVNDEGAYYVINLGLLENLSLNYGREYSKWNTVENANSTIYKDLYIINGVTHQIYYPMGIKTVDKAYYFTKIESTNDVITEINLDRDIFNISISNENNGEIRKYKINFLASNYKINNVKYAWSVYSDVEDKNKLNTFTNLIPENGNYIITANTSEIDKNKYLWVIVTDSYGEEHINILVDSVTITDVRTTVYPEDKSKKIVSADVEIVNNTSEYHNEKLEYGLLENGNIENKLSVKFLPFKVNINEETGTHVGKVTLDSKPIVDTVDCYLWIKITDNYGEEHITIKKLK